MSHEASSERIAYRREHNLPFQAWPTGKTRGIAQMRNALELVELDKPHPFRPQFLGHPQLYLVVDDHEMINPKTDGGLARWRAEMPAYRWATLKTGEPTVQVVPHALFNDAIDTVRAGAADYWPRSLDLTPAEQIAKVLPDKYNPITLKENYSPEREMSINFQLAQAKQKVTASNWQMFDRDGNLINELENV